jgi:simple sugar transport system permease protein
MQCDHRRVCRRPGEAYFTLESVPSFEPMMTNGRFHFLTAMIFGNWRL